MTKTVCKTNIKRALRKSWDSHAYEAVNDEWMACIERNTSYLGVPPMCPFHVCLWNWETGEEVWTNVGGCESMSEYIDYAADCLLQKWEASDLRHAA